jgi:hypothetical protein
MIEWISKNSQETSIIQRYCYWKFWRLHMIKTITFLSGILLAATAMAQTAAPATAPAMPVTPAPTPAVIATPAVTATPAAAQTPAPVQAAAPKAQEKSGQKIGQKQQKEQESEKEKQDAVMHAMAALGAWPQESPSPQRPPRGGLCIFGRLHLKASLLARTVCSLRSSALKRPRSKTG